jgi:RNA polymerase sigma-70 factor (ECF subfamily)
VSETFATAWRRRKEVPVTRMDLPWLIVTARQLMANQARSRHNRADVVKRLGHQLGRVVASQSEPLDEERVTARNAFDKLSREDQEILAHFGWDGLSVPEIARALDLSTNAVSGRLHRARTRFSVVLRDEGLAVDRTEEEDAGHQTPALHACKGGHHAD